jgi:uncharacterized phage protein gp47/JayE
MAFGITESGFIRKRLADILPELQEALRSSLGAGINLDDRSALGVITNTYAAQLAAAHELIEAIYNSYYPDTAEGTSLDNVASITNQLRLEAIKSTVEARITGTALTAIPAIGTFILSVDGDTTARFVNTETGVIGAAGIDEVQDIDFSAVPTSGNFKLRYNLTETTAVIPWNATNTDVQTALNALASLSAVTVVGNFTAGFTVTFAGADGEKDQPILEAIDNTLNGGITISIVETTRGWLPYVDIDFEAETAGEVQAPANSLTVIETPVTGIDAAENLLDATVGREIETDPDFKTRRLEQLQRAGTATIEGIRNNVLAVDSVSQAAVFENATGVFDAFGRPPHSFETIVNGGVDDDIADAIFEAKGAGIKAYGTTIVAVTDSMNVSHDIGFSRPTELDIWMIINITANVDPTEGSLYPSDGDDQVEAAVLAYAADFLMGQDVVVNQFYTPINTIAGVIGVEVLVGFSSPPTLSNNLSIDPDAIAVFDSTRITVNS